MCFLNQENLEVLHTCSLSFIIRIQKLFKSNCLINAYQDYGKTGKTGRKQNEIVSTHRKCIGVYCNFPASERYFVSIKSTFFLE